MWCEWVCIWDRKRSQIWSFSELHKHLFILSIWWNVPIYIIILPLQPFCSLHLQLQMSENPYLSGTISTKATAPGIIVATGKRRDSQQTPSQNLFLLSRPCGDFLWKGIFSFVVQIMDARDFGWSVVLRSSSPSQPSHLCFCLRPSLSYTGHGALQNLHFLHLSRCHTAQPLIRKNSSPVSVSQQVWKHWKELKEMIREKTDMFGLIGRVSR